MTDLFSFLVFIAMSAGLFELTRTWFREVGEHVEGED